VKKAQSESATTEGNDEKAEKTRRIKALMIETGISTRIIQYSFDDHI